MENIEHTRKELNSRQPIVCESGAASDDSPGLASDEAIQGGDRDIYQALAECVSDAILVLQGGKIIYYNPACTQLLGPMLAETKQMGRCFIELFASEYREQLSTFFKQLWRGEIQSSPYEVVLSSGEAQRTTIEIKFSLIEHQHRPATLVLMRDISELKRIEAAFQESENQRHHLMTSSEAFIYTHDLDGFLCSVNSAMAQTLGYCPNEMIGKIFKVLFAPSWKHHFDHYLECARQKSRYGGLLHISDREGHEHIWSYQSIQYQESSGSKNILSYAQDVINVSQYEVTIERHQEKNNVWEKDFIENTFSSREMSVACDQIIFDFFGYTRKEDLLSHIINLTNYNEDLELKLEDLRNKLDNIQRGYNVLEEHEIKKHDDELNSIIYEIKNMIMPIVKTILKDKNLEIYLPQVAILTGYIEGLSSKHSNIEIRNTGFSSRELQIASMIKNGLTGEEIAMRLDISPETVKSHKRNIRKKLNITNTKKNLNAYLQSIDSYSA